MSRRPGRAKMCSWLSGELLNLAGRTEPFNPADVKQMTYNARDVDLRLSYLGHIASDLGWHADADLNRAWEAIKAYEDLPRRQVADEYTKKRPGVVGQGGENHANT